MGFNAKEVGRRPRCSAHVFNSGYVDREGIGHVFSDVIHVQPIEKQQTEQRSDSVITRALNYIFGKKNNNKE